MGNNKKLPIQKFSKKVKVDRKERGLPLPIQFRAETFEWVMVMVDRKERPESNLSSPPADPGVCKNWLKIRKICHGKKVSKDFISTWIHHSNPYFLKFEMNQTFSF